MNTLIPLEQEINDAFPWITHDSGMSIVGSNYDSESFGNSFITLKGEMFLVRIVRDRGQTSMEIASEQDPESWWLFEDVYEIITGKPITPGADLSTLVSYLQRIFSELPMRFGQGFPEMRVELERREEDRKQEMLKRFSS